jgi:hypothetical protein
VNKDQKFADIKKAALELGEFDRGVLIAIMDANGRIRMSYNGPPDAIHALADLTTESIGYLLALKPNYEARRVN